MSNWVDWDLEKSAHDTGGGHWATINGGTSSQTGEHHGVHIFIDKSGRVTKGPAELVKKLNAKHDSPKEDHERTADEFHEKRTEYARKHGADQAKLDQFYPRGESNRQHAEKVHKALQNGQKVPAHVIDSMEEEHRRRILHDNPGAADAYAKYRAAKEHSSDEAKQERDEDAAKKAKQEAAAKKAKEAEEKSTRKKQREEHKRVKESAEAHKQAADEQNHEAAMKEHGIPSVYMHESTRPEGVKGPVVVSQRPLPGEHSWKGERSGNGVY